MANSLLDFVMSLVRDPDAAAHYAADPAQAIADANLTDVTSVDVNHLIPVVAESMSTVVPTGSPAFGTSQGADSLGDSAHNVWASGAATAAFDAFDDHLPIHGADWATGELAGQVPTVASVIQQPEDSAPTIVDHGFDALDVPTIATGAETQLGQDVPTYEDAHALADPAAEAFGIDQHAASDAVDDHLDHLDHPHDPGFDVFT